ncbi:MULTISPECIES: alpha/beta hydrolase family protein [unclassified Agromyces]|uniref:alpha/beta hydrolase family protein n=1 Tax=unclassified Agromyces TaxID=2639701 RepID=UPI003014C1B6
MRAGWAFAALGAAAAASFGGLGFVIARRLTAPSSGRRFDLVVRRVESTADREWVVLDRTPQTTSPGKYSLLLEDGLLIRLGNEVEDRGPQLIAREAVGRNTLAGVSAGDRASWSGIYFADPSDAGLGATDVRVPTAVGPAPAWLVETAGAASSTWAIHIHGLGSPRAGTIRGVQVAAELGLTSLVLTYRNDGEGPRVGSGRSTLGRTETDDVRSAMAYAREHGAERFILFGWSMGGAIALQIASDPESRSDITALVLDSPVVDWVATIRANCVRSGLPAWAGGLAQPWLDRPALARLVGLPNAIGLGRFDWVARATEIRVPTLILHGTFDSSSPFDAVARLRDRRPDLVELETFEADHTMNWNSDPDRWRLAVRTWLSPRI